jgi:RNA polymerase sigma-70 factor (ECF subfamily)
MHALATQTSTSVAAMRSLGDAALMRACRERNEDAWAALVERFSRYVYAIAMQAYRLPEPDAEEVFQEVFSRTYEHLDRLRSDEAIRPWIGQLTRRLAIDRLRLSGRAQLGDASIEVIDVRASEELARLDEALSVHAAMATLPEHCHEILDRFFARDQSYREIAAALELAMGTIASRINRCLAKLREQLAGAPR